MGEQLIEVIVEGLRDFGGTGGPPGLDRDARAFSLLDRGPIGNRGLHQQRAVRVAQFFAKAKSTRLLLAESLQCALVP